MKKKITLYTRLIICASALVGCSKNPELYGTLSSRIIITTQAASAITQISATSGVQVSAGFSSDVLDKGICWAVTANPTIALNKLSGGQGNGSNNMSLTGLSAGKTYYIKGYVTTRNETIYGDQQQFTTLNYQLATLTSSAITNISQTTAVGGGNVTNAGGGSVSAKGTCWSTVAGATILNTHTTDGTDLGAYSSAISGLNPGTIYHVRAYAINQAGTAYGPELTFTTIAIQLATVSTITASGITKNTAIVSGSVTADGGGAISSRGVCWSAGSTPYVPQNSYFSSGSGIGTISTTLTGLVTGTTYYVRAYAINAAGTSYGSLVSFRTL